MGELAIDYSGLPDDELDVLLAKLAAAVEEDDSAAGWAIGVAEEKARRITAGIGYAGTARAEVAGERRRVEPAEVAARP